MDVKAPGCLKRFLRKELRWKNLWFDVKNPTKFATTAWLQSQIPFLVYRIVCFVYCASILSWGVYKASQLTSAHEVATWFLSYPPWGFMLMTLYNTLSLLLVALNFNYDCLCNDDLSWYHKVSWLLHVVSFNTAVMSMFATMIYFISRAANDSTGITLTEALKSDDINFYVICAFVMSIDVFICSIPIRFLHFLYPSFFFIVFVLIHVYRWAAGYVPTHTIFAFSSTPIATTVLFSVFIVFLFIPLLHLLAYGIDTMRRNVILKIRARNMRKVLQEANSSISPLTMARTGTQAPHSSIRYKTSSLQNRVKFPDEKYKAGGGRRSIKTRQRPDTPLPSSSRKSQRESSKTPKKATDISSSRATRTRERNELSSSMRGSLSSRSTRTRERKELSSSMRESSSSRSTRARERNDLSSSARESSSSRSTRASKRNESSLSRSMKSREDVRISFPRLSRMREEIGSSLSRVAKSRESVEIPLSQLSGTSSRERSSSPQARQTNETPSIGLTAISRNECSRPQLRQESESTKSKEAQSAFSRLSEMREEIGSPHSRLAKFRDSVDISLSRLSTSRLREKSPSAKERQTDEAPPTHEIIEDETLRPQSRQGEETSSTAMQTNDSAGRMTSA